MCCFISSREPIKPYMDGVNEMLKELFLLFFFLVDPKNQGGLHKPKNNKLVPV